MLDSLSKCCGIIILNKSLSKTILVTSRYGNYSFPKGKRRNGESDFSCAVREMNEETGISMDNLDICDTYIDEISKKGYISVRYAVAVVKNENIVLSFDPNELLSVDWIAITDVEFSKLKPKRKEILKKALHIAKIYNFQPFKNALTQTLPP